MAKSIMDRVVRRWRPRWVRQALAEYERFDPVQAIGLPAGQLLCVVAPHPDDESIGCGGLLALWAAAGRQAEVVFLTAGERGSSEVRTAPDATTRAALMTTLRATRRAEAVAALKVLRAQGRWLDGTDGALHGDEERLVTELAALWQATPPDVIAAPYPSDRHPDHAIAARIVGRAAGRVLPEATTILGYEVWSAAPINVVLDIAAVADLKWRAIAAHGSQVATTDYVRAAQALNTYRAITAGQKTAYAEAFYLTQSADFQRIANNLKV